MKSLKNYFERKKVIEVHLCLFCTLKPVRIVICFIEQQNSVTLNMKSNLLQTKEKKNKKVKSKC